MNGKLVHQFSNMSSFAEQMLVHENAVARIDRDIPLDRAALVGCGVLTGVGAVIHAAKVKPGATVAVIGCGGVGLSVVSGAILAGAGRVIAIDMPGAETRRPLPGQHKFVFVQFKHPPDPPGAPGMRGAAVRLAPRPAISVAGSDSAAARVASNVPSAMSDSARRAPCASGRAAIAVATVPTAPRPAPTAAGPRETAG